MIDLDVTLSVGVVCSRLMERDLRFVWTLKIPSGSPQLIMPDHLMSMAFMLLTPMR